MKNGSVVRRILTCDCSEWQRRSRCRSNLERVKIKMYIQPTITYCQQSKGFVFRECFSLLPGEDTGNNGLRNVDADPAVNWIACVRLVKSSGFSRAPATPWFRGSVRRGLTSPPPFSGGREHGLLLGGLCVWFPVHPRNQQKPIIQRG